MSTDWMRSEDLFWPVLGRTKTLFSKLLLMRSNEFLVGFPGKMFGFVWPACCLGLDIDCWRYTPFNDDAG